MVKLMAHPDTIARIDQRLFPLTNETIDEMPKYLETVNTIIKNWGLKEISTQELSLIQAFIRGNNNPTEIVQIEKEYHTNMVVWLGMYLELMRKNQMEKEYQNSWSAKEGAHELSSETQDRMMKVIRAQLKTLDDVNNILHQYK